MFFGRIIFSWRALFWAEVRPRGLEKGQICRKKNVSRRLISGPDERRVARQFRPWEAGGRAAGPPRKRPGGFRPPPIRCKNCAKFPRLLCPPNNMSPLPSHLFSVRPPFARRTTVDEDDGRGRRRRRRSADGEKEL